MRNKYFGFGFLYSSFMRYSCRWWQPTCHIMNQWGTRSNTQIPVFIFYGWRYCLSWYIFELWCLKHGSENFQHQIEWTLPELFNSSSTLQGNVLCTISIFYLSYVAKGFSIQPDSVRLFFFSHPALTTANRRVNKIRKWCRTFSRCMDWEKYNKYTNHYL